MSVVSFFSPPFEREVEENEEGQWNKEASCIRRHPDTPEDRQKVATVFTKETKETFDVERIHTWFRNHKKKNKGGGEEGEGGSLSKDITFT